MAILASGYSSFKLYSLVFGISSIMVCFQFINLAFLEPTANGIARQEIKKTKKTDGKYLTRSSLDGGTFWYKSKNYFATFTYFDRNQNSLLNLELFYFNEKNLLKQMVTAKTAKFISPQNWVLTNPQIISHTEDVGFPQMTTSKQMNYPLIESPEDFGEFEADLTTLNFFKLRSFINKISNSGINTNEYELILFQILSVSLSCWIFALLPLQAIFNPNRRSGSFGKSVITVLSFTLSFWIIQSFCLSLGDKGTLTPEISSFLPIILFSCYVIYVFLKNRKLAI
jgi:lipopolysaccharide export LptBFGC system permease protein LptF